MGLLTDLLGDGNATYRVDTSTRTPSSDRVCNSTTWADFDTGMDLSLSVSEGEWIEVILSGRYKDEAVYCFLDAVSVTSGRHMSIGGGAPAGQGWPGWGGMPSVETPISGSLLYQVQADDISSGVITIRIRYRTYTAANKTVAGLFYAQAKVVAPPH